MTPSELVIACRPLIDLVTKLTSAEVVLGESGAYWTHDPGLRLTMPTGTWTDEEVVDNLLHELCHWGVASETARGLDNLGLAGVFYRRWHALWPRYDHDCPRRQGRGLVPWEIGPMCVEMDVWATAGIFPEAPDDDYRSAAFIRLRHQVGRRYVERVIARLPPGFIEQTACAYRQARENIRQAKASLPS